MPRRERIASALAFASVLVALLALAPTAGSEYDEGLASPNPCFGELADQLRCPDLQIAPPAHLFRKHDLLHAENNIMSRGEGPIEIGGRRTGSRTMDAFQRIHTTVGGRTAFDIPAVLRFYFIPGKGRYWKFHEAARFELWTMTPDGDPEALVRLGPKLNYCFRDLRRTLPLDVSPRHRVYPACSQNPHRKSVTLGTSIGWSDIYPAHYYQNWINVRGLTGCFLFIHRADPDNLIYEDDETNNLNWRRVALGGGKVTSC